MLRRVLTLLAIVGAGLAVGSAPAGADCVGPTITYDAGEVHRGATVTVRGVAFGDACHDTGPPPPGEDVLGHPIEDIEVVVVQDPLELVVATGSADERYEFEVAAPVPAELRPGPARVLVRWGERGRAADRSWSPLVVLDDPPLPAPTAPVRFGPEDEPDTEAGEDGADRDDHADRDDRADREGAAATNRGDSPPSGDVTAVPSDAPMSSAWPTAVALVAGIGGAALAVRTGRLRRRA